jgi:hypothetical protein
VSGGAAGDPAGLVFILGFPRSGTTLLAQVLATAPDVLVFEERPLLVKAIADFVDSPNGAQKLAAARASDLAPYAADFWRQARAEADPRGKLVIEQTAFNTVYLPVIARLFPDAKIVFAVRDPRDVVFSCFRRQFAPSRFTLEFRTLESTAGFYDATMRLADLCRPELGARMFDIRNEDLIADFDSQSRRLCEFTGVSWREEMRHFEVAAEGRALTTRSAQQIRRGLVKDGVGVWRRYAAQMAPVLPILAPWVERFGYPPN